VAKFLGRRPGTLGYFDYFSGGVVGLLDWRSFGVIFDFLEREKEYLAQGGHFIFALPEFTVV